MSSVTRHCCVVAVCNFGILIEGKSGSGKTSLMFGLQEYLSGVGISATVVSDDYTNLESASGVILANTPDTISGKAEIRGFGVVPVAYSEHPVPIGLVVQLVEGDQVPRMRECETTEILGQPLEVLKVPVRHEEGALRIVLAWLRDNTDIALPLAGS